MASLDIAERRLPQDGRIKLKLGKGTRDGLPRHRAARRCSARRSSCASSTRRNLQLDMTKLGFEQKPLEDFKEAINQPYGMVLVTGPTGSGKTTTLYSALSELNKIDDQHHHRRGSGRVQPARHQPGADARRHRPELRRRAARLPAPGPGHHHGRRDPRLRDRGDRGQGRAHRPPGALDAAHQRRARDDLAPAQHGRRAVPRHRVASTSSSPSASRARSAPTASAETEIDAEALLDIGFTEEQIAQRAARARAPAAAPATTPATRAASRSTRSCRSPTR